MFLSKYQYIIYIHINDLKLVKFLHISKQQNCKNMSININDVDAQYIFSSVCTVISNISLEHMYRQLPQKSIRAGFDDNKQVTL